MIYDSFGFPAHTNEANEPTFFKISKATDRFTFFDVFICMKIQWIAIEIIALFIATGVLLPLLHEFKFEFLFLNYNSRCYFFLNTHVSCSSSIFIFFWVSVFHFFLILYWNKNVDNVDFYFQQLINLDVNGSTRCSVEINIIILSVIDENKKHSWLCDMTTSNRLFWTFLSFAHQ